MITLPDLVVADLMSLEPIVIGADDSIDQAEALLRDFSISGLPVVDEDGHLVGVFSQSDVLHLRKPHISDLIRGRTSGIRVGEVMSRPPVTVDTLAPIADAAQQMVSHDIHRLVAVDGDGRPIGVLTSMDFVKLVADADRSRGPLADNARA